MSKRKRIKWILKFLRKEWVCTAFQRKANFYLIAFFLSLFNFLVTEAKGVSKKGNKNLPESQWEAAFPISEKGHGIKDRILRKENLGRFGTEPAFVRYETSYKVSFSSQNRNRWWVQRTLVRIAVRTFKFFPFNVSNFNKCDCLLSKLTSNYSEIWVFCTEVL